MNTDTVTYKTFIDFFTSEYVNRKGENQKVSRITVKNDDANYPSERLSNYEVADEIVAGLQLSDPKIVDRLRGHKVKISGNLTNGFNNSLQFKVVMIELAETK